MATANRFRYLARGSLVVLSVAALASCGSGSKVDSHEVQASCGALGSAAPAMRIGELPLPSSVQGTLLQAVTAAEQCGDHRLSSALDKIRDEVLAPITGASKAAIEAAWTDASRECAARGYPVGAG